MTRRTSEGTGIVRTYVRTSTVGYFLTEYLLRILFTSMDTIVNTSSYLVPKAASDEPNVEESDTSTSTAASFLLYQTTIAFGFALVSIVVRIADFL